VPSESKAIVYNVHFVKAVECYAYFKQVMCPEDALENRNNSNRN